MNKTTCFHCGDTCSIVVSFNEKDFCCNGCKMVYEILNQNELTAYYEIEKNAGKKPEIVTGKYDYLDSPKIANSLLEFVNDDIQIINLYIPHIHCSSCIWVLENLNKLDVNIIISQVNFPKKTVRITYNFNDISLKKVVLLLSSIGYEPYISLDNSKLKTNKKDYTLLIKLAVAGFAFGNVMFLSFPEYFEVSGFWLDQYKPFFRFIMLIFSIPVILYSAQDYFISAYKGLKYKLLNIDVPIALGMLVLFFRSVYEITTNSGQGFLDSFCGLVFFLLLGKFFQQKTYSFLSFERDYKSYFPIAVTRLFDNSEESVAIQEVKKGDRLLIRNEELIPVDCLLLKGEAMVDYSFVTGESNPVSKHLNDKLFAGGKQTSGAIEVEVLKSISQSYLTQLWSNDAFKINKEDQLETITNRVSKYFTIIILLITFFSALYWYFVDTSKIVNVITSVLIVACPCALALSAPFTLGNVLRIFGKQKMYLKNAKVIEALSRITTVVFDKTGTLTYSRQSQVEYIGKEFSPQEERAVKSILRQSNHPLSRMIYDSFSDGTTEVVDQFVENIGSGISGKVKNIFVKIGSASFVNAISNVENETVVHVQVSGNNYGKFIIKNVYRSGVSEVFELLKMAKYKIIILSGDNEGEREKLESIAPAGTQLIFQKKPSEKLEFIKALQSQNENVLMIGDGLNDAGALAQGDVGIVISENVNVFSPACDAIIAAENFENIPDLLKHSKISNIIIVLSFIFSFSYNIVGLYFAVTGNLSPIIAAILMPLSSISIVVFVTIATNSFLKFKE